MSSSPTGTHAKSAGAVTETIDMETILREISRTLQALSGQIARLEHLHAREITAGMQTLSHQIALVHDRLDSVMLRNGASDIMARPTGITTPSTQQVTTPSTQHVMVKTEQRPPNPPAGLLRGAKPMPPPPPIRSYRSSPY
eukprot:281498-Amphidinium_carterae.1